MTDAPVSRSSSGSDWAPLKMALWRVLMAENLNDGHYIKAFDLIEKLYIAAESAGVAQAPLGPCTQAELDAFEGLDAKSKQLFSLWVDRALKAEAAILSPPAPLQAGENLIADLETAVSNRLADCAKGAELEKAREALRAALSLSSTDRDIPSGAEHPANYRKAFARPLCSCKASERDGQHMAWCPAVSSTPRRGEA